MTTLTAAVPLLSSAVAVIVAIPAAIAVTIAVPSGRPVTVATPASLELQLTVPRGSRPPAPSLSTAVNVVVSPVRTNAESGATCTDPSSPTRTAATPAWPSTSARMCA